MASDSAQAVLVVDDHPIMLDVIARLLATLGFTDVDHAADGAAALERMRARSYALVISDWNMEPMSGLEFLQAVRADPGLCRTRFLMTTASSQAARRIAAREAGVDAYLVKPFTPSALRQKIEGLLPVDRTRPQPVGAEAFGE